jgi:hypothetical protein
MIVNSGTDFTSQVNEKWAGKEVTVTKTTPMKPVNIRIETVKMAGWEEVDRRIQEKHGRETGFLMVGGPAVAGDSGEDRENVLQMVVIPVDDHTVYDVREERLVVLTDREVVQFSRTGD